MPKLETVVKSEPKHGLELSFPKMSIKTVDLAGGVPKSKTRR